MCVISLLKELLGVLCVHTESRYMNNHVHRALLLNKKENRDRKRKNLIN